MMPSDVSRIDNKHYTVRIQRSKPQRDVAWNGHDWVCACPDYKILSTCEHARRIEISANMREAAAPKDPQGYNSAKECFFCHSNNVKKHSIWHSKLGDIQRYICNDCGRRYSFNPYKHDAHTVIRVMELHFTGKSQTKIETMLRESASVKVTQQTISRWIQRYTAAMKVYLLRILPALSKEWNPKLKTSVANQTFLKARDDSGFLFSLLDTDTKYWLAMEIWTNPDFHEKEPSKCELLLPISLCPTAQT